MKWCQVDRKGNVVGWLVEQSLTPHPTQYRSFRRRSSQPITWLILTNKAVQENKERQCGTKLLFLYKLHDLIWTPTWKASCRWQIRATLAKRLHGLCKSSGVVSCIARLPFDSLHMVSYYRPMVHLCLKCTVFEIWWHTGRKSPKNLPHPHLARSFGVTPCEIFDDSYLARN